MASKEEQLKKAKSLIKIRIPVPPPNKVFKTNKDYNRRKGKIAVKKLIIEND